MALNKKDFREMIGYTFSQQGKDSENWYNKACAFNEAAKLLYEKSEGNRSIAYYYNAGLSIELILKAIILAKSKSFRTNHYLKALCRNAEIELTDDQICTIELFSEVIIWSGRYPTPKKGGQWDNYHDVILEKHIVREKDGNTYRTIAHRKRFPSLENYKKIWDVCENEYKNIANRPA